MDTLAKVEAGKSLTDFGSDLGRTARSVIGALAYADLFDYPLSVEEVTRYQIETAFPLAVITRCLEALANVDRVVSREGDFYCLQGRESVFETRRNRDVASRRVWKKAHSGARWVSGLPFVRMVAVTGALAVDNIAARPDIDLLIVTKEGRVWIGRRLIVGVVRLARLFGDDLCPNYIIARTNLNLDQHDLFTAHELSQMVPLHGASLYSRMIEQNGWAREYLPMAFDRPPEDISRTRVGLLRRVAEAVLSRRLFDGWERWEQIRLQRKLRPLVGDAAEVICSPEQCKGHTGLHRQWVTKRYSERLRELGF